MPSPLVDQFKTRFESLKGHVYVVASEDDVPGVVLRICAEAKAQCVALGELPPALQEAIASGANAQDTRVLRPPYRHEDLPGGLDEAQVGVGWAHFGVAQTATLAEIALDDAYRLVSSLPRTYIGILDAREMVPELKDAAVRLRDAFAANEGNCVVSFISGPSRTGDIEMILTLGVHGPEHAHAIIIDEGSA